MDTNTATFWSVKTILLVPAFRIYTFFLEFRGLIWTSPITEQRHPTNIDLFDLSSSCPGWQTGPRAAFVLFHEAIPDRNSKGTGQPRKPEFPRQYLSYIEWTLRINTANLDSGFSQYRSRGILICIRISYSTLLVFQLFFGLQNIQSLKKMINDSECNDGTFFSDKVKLTLFFLAVF